MSRKTVVTKIAEPDEDEARPKSVLGKAQLLLGAFGSGAYRLKLTELSRRSGVPKASAYRLAQELVRWGLLERSGDSYQLGLRMFELGQRVPVSGVLRSIARPVLADLFAATRATIHLAVLDGTHVLYVEKVAGEANVHSHSHVGGRLPASCTATGKVLLALHRDSEETLHRLERGALSRPTSRAVPSVALLRRQLATIADRGCAVEIEEMLPGFGSLAVPIVDVDGAAYAAISATVPLDRLAVRQLLPVLREAAATISRAVDRRMIMESVEQPRLHVVAG
jgi:DNA-binding IclR family transcriptional regulator